MTTKIDSKYLNELKHLIDLSYIAIEKINNTIEHIAEKDFKKNMDLCWYHINSLLIFVARISRFLWGSKGKENTLKRAKTIRKILNISDDSIFNQLNRKIRNSFDHIDEIIDKAVNKSIKFSNLDRNIGNIKQMIGNKTTGDYMRHYDPITKTIYFAENFLSIPDLLVELKKLENNIER